MNYKMNLIFIGPQGSGKGTQAKIIAKKLDICHISTGDLLRGVEGSLKEKVESYTLKGDLVPDELILEILKERLKKQDCRNGFILDGYPRNLKQAEDLDKITEIDKVIEIKISDETAIKRLSGRWNCNKCNIAYNVITEPKPEKEGICDKCGDPLTQREDEKLAAIKKRLEIYHEETEPVLEHYAFIKVDGEKSIKQVVEDILASLS